MVSLNLVPRHVYGLTESYGPLTVSYDLPEWELLPPKQKFAKMARQGHGFLTSLPVRVIKTNQPEGVLVDVEKNGQEIGEIVFFGNICSKGYYKDEEATRKLFAGGGLHTGDLAVWEEDGSVRILDRAKDIIISGMFAQWFSISPWFAFIYSLPLLARPSNSITRRRKHLLRGPRRPASRAPLHTRSGRRRRAGLTLGRETEGLYHRSGTGHRRSNHSVG